MSNNTTTFTFFSFRFFIALLFFVFVVIGMTLYFVIKPNYTIKYNFNPLPNVTVKDLPSINNTTSVCYNSLVECKSDSDCSECTSGDYKCKTVNSDDNIELNNMKVPEGKWCLPKFNNNTECNKFTGKWLWVNDPDYCLSVNGNTQCWKCECLYKNLFSGDDCTKQIACKNGNYDNNSGNKLIASKYIPESEYVGLEWDPTSTDQRTIDMITKYSPYSSGEGENSKPYFMCSCDGSYPKSVDEIGKITPFVRLPGDYYNCHQNKCYSAVGNILPSNIPPPSGQCSTNDSATTDKRICCDDDSGLCSCDCGGMEGDLFVAPSGPYQGLCVSINDPSICSNDTGTVRGVWDKNLGKCDCGDPEYEQVGCTPESCPNNKIGIQCLSKCRNINCGNYTLNKDGIPIYDNGKCGCDCDPQVIGVGNTNKDSVDFIGSSELGICDQACVKDGTIIKINGSLIGLGPEPVNNGNFCDIRTKYYGKMDVPPVDICCSKNLNTYVENINTTNSKGQQINNGIIYTCGDVDLPKSFIKNPKCGQI